MNYSNSQPREHLPVARWGQTPVSERVPDANTATPDSTDNPSAGGLDCPSPTPHNRRYTLSTSFEQHPNRGENLTTLFNQGATTAKTDQAVYAGDISARTRKRKLISIPYWNRVCRTEVYSSDSPANCQKTISCLPSVSNLVSPQSVILRTCATVSAKQSTCCLSSLDVVQFTRISPCTVSAAYHRTDSGLSRYRATYAMFRHLRPTQ